jgi:phage/plasmid-like protein (TIGR03299 family)
MAANVETMMYNVQEGVPWHGLGKAVAGRVTSAEAIKAGGLDWSVAVEKMVLASGGQEVPNHYAVVRQDRRAVLGVVGDRFEPLQNVEAFASFDKVFGQEAAIYETCGALGVGEKVWLLAKLPDTFEVVKGDVITKYVLLAMGHDGSMSVKVGKTAIRVVCQNTLNLALGSRENFVSVRHTGDIRKRVDDAFRVLGLVKQQYAELEAFFKFLASRPLFGENLNKVVSDIFPAPEGEQPSTRLTNIRSSVLNRITTGKGVEIPGVRGTAWAAFNGVTEYLDHFRVMKGTDDDASAARSRRMESILFGNVAETRERAGKIIAAAVA